MWRIRVTKCIHVLRTIIVSLLSAELVCYQSDLDSFPRAALRNDFWLCDVLTFGRVELCFQNQSYQLRHYRSFIISHKTCRKTCVTKQKLFFLWSAGSRCPEKECSVLCRFILYMCFSILHDILHCFSSDTFTVSVDTARMQNHLQCNGIHRLLRCCCHDRRFCLANRHTATEWHSVAVFGVRVQFKRNVWWTPGVHGIHAVRGIVYWNPSWRNILRSYHRASRWTIKKVKGNKK